jgi:hypothetical protein
VTYLSLVEPASLVDAFVAHPPRDFTAERAPGGMPTFLASYDLLTTVDDALRLRIQGLPLFRYWGGLLRWRTRFAGCTVTEYAPLPRELAPDALAQVLLEHYGRECQLLIVKDIACDSPLLDPRSAAQARDFSQALVDNGFVLLEGMSLAWLPIDFDSVEAYVARLSSGRRADVRRKLKSRRRLEVDVVPMGVACFEDDATVARLYELYLNVYAQSEVHFDLLEEGFFRAILRDGGSGGLLFTYRHAGELIGWKICYEHAGMLLDKYVGFAYPQAREHDLYFVSWFHCLEFALQRGLSHYVAGWTDARIKRYLGARMTRTRHAVYVRNPVLRWLLRRLAHHFESEPGT